MGYCFVQVVPRSMGESAHGPYNFLVSSSASKF